MCSDDEDRSTQSRRRRALIQASRAEGDVTVDLSALAFADTSLVFDLAMLSNRLRRHDRALVLRGAAPQVLYLIELVGVHRLPGVQIEPAAEPAADPNRAVAPA